MAVSQNRGTLVDHPKMTSRDFQGCQPSRVLPFGAGFVHQLQDGPGWIMKVTKIILVLVVLACGPQCY